MKKYTLLLFFILTLSFTFACDGAGIGGGSKIAGADDELIKKTIIGTRLVIDGEEWIINDAMIDSISIVSQETTREKDVVEIDVELKDITLSATGQMHLEFKYNEDNESWAATDHRVSAPFETSFLPHAGLDISNDGLISELTKHSIVYNEIAAKTAFDIKKEQLMVGIVGSIIGMPFLSSLAGDQDPTEAILETMTFTADEVSGFNIILVDLKEKGTIGTYYTSFILSKGVIDYEVFSEVVYHYDRVNGWLLQDVGFTAIIDSVNLNNTKWVGTFEPWTRGSFVPNQLTIEFDDFSTGSGSATATAAPPEFKQALTGTVDSLSLTVNLIFNEYVQEPSFDGIRLGTFVSQEDAISRSRINIKGTIDPFGTIIRSDSGTKFEISLLP